MLYITTKDRMMSSLVREKIECWIVPIWYRNSGPFQKKTPPFGVVAERLERQACDWEVAGLIPAPARTEKEVTTWSGGQEADGCVATTGARTHTHTPPHCQCHCGPLIKALNPPKVIPRVLDVS